MSTTIKHNEQARLYPKERYTYSPFHLTAFTIEDDDKQDTLKKKAIQDIQALSRLMQQNQNEFYNSPAWAELVTQIANENKDLTGKKNHAGRAYDLKPAHLPAYQPYNFAEMYRHNIMSSVEAYVQRLRIAWILNQEDEPDDAETQQRYIDLYGLKNIPSRVMIGKIRAARDNGCIQSVPRSNGKLSFSATDGHYRQIESDKEKVRFTVKLPTAGRVTLVFDRPVDQRFHLDGQKVPAPDVVLRDDGVPVFTFSAYQPAPKLHAVRGWLGVDLGVVAPYVASIVTEECFSQPFEPSRRVWRIVERLSNQQRNISDLRAKIGYCEVCGRWSKADRLRVELSCVVSARSRLKAELARQVAHELVSIAVETDMGVAFENLSWVPESHWNQSAVQSATRCLASRFGVPVVKVNAAGTSQRCARCGEDGRVDSSGDRGFCCVNEECVGARAACCRDERRERARARHKRLSRESQEARSRGVSRRRRRKRRRSRSRRGVGRDINASRNIGCEAVGLEKLPLQYFRFVIHQKREASVSASSSFTGNASSSGTQTRPVIRSRRTRTLTQTPRNTSKMYNNGKVLRLHQTT